MPAFAGLPAAAGAARQLASQRLYLETAWDVEGQLLLLLLLAFGLGLGKGGVPGVATIATAVTVATAPSGGLATAVAVQVPILMVIDVATAGLHRTSIDRKAIQRLLPAACVGMAVGATLGHRLDEAMVRLLMGGMLLGLLGLRAAEQQVAPDRSDGSEPAPEPVRPSAVELQGSATKELNGGSPAAGKAHVGWILLVGIVGGAATMLTNSMGPLLNLYLLSVLKMRPTAFVSTRSMFFCLVNLIKGPVRLLDGSITAAVLRLSLALAVAALAGIATATPVLRRIDPSLFTKLELGVVAISGLRLFASGYAAL